MWKNVFADSSAMFLASQKCAKLFFVQPDTASICGKVADEE